MTKPNIVSVFRKSHFNAAHRLHNPSWDDEKNREVFGVCNNPNYHGHNYELIVKVTGEIDPATGYVMDMKVLQDLIDEFRNLNPTAENIAIVIWNILRECIEPSKELSIILYETDRNFVEYNGHGA